VSGSTATFWAVSDVFRTHTKPRCGATNSDLESGLDDLLKTRLLVIALAALVTGGSAIAADLRRPVYKAPDAPRMDDWSGPYIGAHLGYDWGRTRVIDNGVLTESGARTDGALGGVLAGYNWQRGMFVFGLEADIAAAAIRGSGIIGPPPPPPPAVVPPPNQYVVNSTGDVRARFGYVIFPGTLIFISGGVAFAGFEFQHGETGQNFGGIYTGGTVGGGIDQKFTQNLIGRIEYLYTDYGNKTYQIGPGDFYNTAFTTQTLRGALIWRFGP